MHRLHSVERNCEVTGVFDVDHKLVPAVRRDRPDGTKLFAAIRYERLESHCDFLLHDLLPAVINSLKTCRCGCVKLHPPSSRVEKTVRWTGTHSRGESPFHEGISSIS